MKQLRPQAQTKPKYDEKHSSDAMIDGIVLDDLPNWPQMLARREYHT